MQLLLRTFIGFLIFLYSSSLQAGLPAGTSIATPSGNVAVEYLTDDHVIGYDLVSGEYLKTSVRAVKAHTVTKLYVISTEQGDLVASADQLLFDLASQKFVAADAWTPASVFFTKKLQKLSTKSIAINACDPTDCYDLSLAQPHLFFAGDLEVLAHNNPFALAAEPLAVALKKAAPVVAALVLMLERSSLSKSTDASGCIRPAQTEPESRVLVSPWSPPVAPATPVSEARPQPIISVSPSTASPVVDVTVRPAVAVPVAKSSVEVPVKDDSAPAGFVTVPPVNALPVSITPIAPTKPNTTISWNGNSVTQSTGSADTIGIRIRTGSSSSAQPLVSTADSIARTLEWWEVENDPNATPDWFLKELQKKAAAENELFDENFLFSQLPFFQHERFLELLRRYPSYDARIIGLHEWLKEKTSASPHWPFSLLPFKRTRGFVINEQLAGYVFKYFGKRTHFYHFIEQLAQEVEARHAKQHEAQVARIEQARLAEIARQEQVRQAAIAVQKNQEQAAVRAQQEALRRQELENNRPIKFCSIDQKNQSVASGSMQDLVGATNAQLGADFVLGNKDYLLEKIAQYQQTLVAGTPKTASIGEQDAEMLAAYAPRWTTATMNADGSVTATDHQYRLRSYDGPTRTWHFEITDDRSKLIAHEDESVADFVAQIERKELADLRVATYLWLVQAKRDSGVGVPSSHPDPKNSKGRGRIPQPKTLSKNDYYALEKLVDERLFSISAIEKMLKSNLAPSRIANVINYGEKVITRNSNRTVHVDRQGDIVVVTDKQTGKVVDVGSVRELKKLNKAAPKTTPAAYFCDTDHAAIQPRGACTLNIINDTAPSCGSGNTSDVIDLPRGPCIDEVKKIPSGPCDAEAEAINNVLQCNWSQQPQLPSLGDSEECVGVENTETGGDANSKIGRGSNGISVREDTPVTIEEIIKNETYPRKKTGGSEQYDKFANQESAQQDFYRTQPENIIDFSTKWGFGKIGTLPDGRTIIYRPGSMEGNPTLEVQRITVNGNIKYKKIRYIGK